MTFQEDWILDKGSIIVIPKGSSQLIVEVERQDLFGQRKT